MKKNLFIFILSLLSVTLLQAQVSAILTGNADVDFYHCGPAGTVSVEIENVSAGTLTGVSIAIDLPNDLEYISASQNMGTWTNADANNPVFSLADIGAGQTVTLNFQAEVGCIIGQASGAPEIGYTFTHSGGSEPQHVQPINTTQTPSVAVTATNNGNTYHIPGDVFTCDFQLTNGSFAPVNSFGIELDLGSGLQVNSAQVVSTGSQATISQSGNVWTLNFNNAGDTIGANSSITIQVQKEVVACGDMSADLTVLWGCPGNLCNSSSQPMGQLTQIDNYTTSIVTSGRVNIQPNISPCDDQVFEFSVSNGSSSSNIGATADVLNFDYELRSTLGAISYLTNARIMSGGIPIKSVSCGPQGAVLACQFQINDYFSTDPDGPGGLEDLDGDGFYDDLAPGEGISIEADFGMDCDTSVCAVGQLPNTVIEGISGLDRCGNHINISRSIRTYHFDRNLTANVDIIDMVHGQSAVFTFEYYQRQPSVSPGLNGLPMRRFNMDFPDGLTFVSGTVKRGTQAAQAITLADLTINGSNVIYEDNSFWGSLEVVTLEMEMMLDCSTSTVGYHTADVDMEVSFDKSCCIRTPACTSTEEFFIHCYVPPCLGIQTQGLTFRRTNFGWADADRTIVADPTNDPSIRDDRAMIYDDVRMCLDGEVASPDYDDMVARLTVFRGNANVAHQVFDLQGTPTFEIFDGTTGALKATYSLGAPEVGYTGFLLDSIYWEWDISTITGTAIYAAGDSVKLTANFRVMDNLPAFASQPYTTGQFKGMFGKRFSDGTFYRCDPWHDFPMAIYTPAPQAVVLNSQPCTGWGGSHGTIVTCTPAWVKAGLYHSSLTNMGGWSPTYFPGEYRDVALIDTMTLILPVGLEYVAGTANFHNWKYGVNEPLADADFDYNPTTRTLTFIPHTFSNYSEWRPSGPAGCDYRRNLETIYFQIQPSGCHTEVTQGDQFTLDVKYDLYLYSAANQVNNLHASNYTSSVHKRMPTYTVTELIPDVVGDEPEECWSVKVRNNSTLYKSDFPFFYINDPDFAITSVTDDLNNVMNLNHLGNGETIVELLPLVPTEERTYSVCFNYFSCDFDSLFYQYGWACNGGYPTSNPGTCYTDEGYLTVDPKNPELRLDVIQQPPDSVDICTQFTIELEGRNVDLGQAQNLNIQAYIPIGGTPISIVNGTSQFRHPANGSYVSIGDPVEINPNIFEWTVPMGTVLAGVQVTNDNTFHLKFDLFASCGFYSGSVVQFSVSAESNCQDTVISDLQDINPIIITGANPATANNLQIGATGQNWAICNATQPYEVSINNLGGNVTTANDKVYVHLPADIAIVANSFSSTSANTAGMNPVPVVSNVAGLTRYCWQLPAGVAINDPMSFSFDIEHTGTLMAGQSYEVITQTVTEVVSICASTQDTCSVDMMTGELIDTIHVSGDTINIDAWPDTSVCPGESVQLMSTFLQGVTYSWSPTTGLDNPNIHNPIATVSGTTVYTVTADNGTGCSDQATVTVTADDTEAPVIHDCPPPVVAGCGAQPGVWTAPTATDNCVVTLTSTHVSGALFPPGVHTVIYTAIDGVGLTAECQFTVTVYDLPTADAGADTAICPGDCILIGGNPTGTGGSGVYTYLWTPAETLCADDIANPIACPDTITTYHVFVIDSVTGCAGTDMITVSFVEPPQNGLFVKDTLRIIMDDNGAFAQPLPPGNQGIVANDDHFGFELDRLDDLDGNGVPEAIIGAPRDNDNDNVPGQVAFRNGAVYLMHFGADGSPAASYKISNSYGDLNTNTSIFLRDRDQFGISVTDMGDVDGDGVRDIAVGAPGTRRPVGNGRTGAVHLLFMNANNTVKGGNTISDGVGGFPAGTLGNTGQLSNSTRYQGYFGFGSALAGAGDWDGDGVSEMLVGNMTDDVDGNNRGAVWFLPIDNAGNVKAADTVRIGDQDLVLANAGGNVLGNNDYFGASVDLIGDVNGDGIDDIAVGAPGDDDGGGNRGAVYICFMQADGNLLSFTKISFNTGVDPAAGQLPLQNNDFFGFAVAEAGDINGDGIPEVWVGCFLDENQGASNNNRRGAVYLMHLQNDGQVAMWNRIDGSSAPNSGVLTDGLTDDDYFGKGIARMYDFDNNCIDALLVGAHREDETQTNLNSSTENEGCVWMIHLGDIFTGNRPAANRGETDVISISKGNTGVPTPQLGGGRESSDIDQALENVVALYPNPTSGFVNISIIPGSSQAVNAGVEITNLVGQAVVRWQGMVEGKFIYPADLTKAAAGQYIVKVTVDGEVVSDMVVKAE